MNFNGPGPEFELPVSLLSREPAEMETVYSAVVRSQKKGRGMGELSYRRKEGLTTGTGTLESWRPDI